MNPYEIFREALNQIDFLSRYRAISAKYQSELNIPVTFSESQITSIASKLDHKITFFKSENLYQLCEDIGAFRINFKFCIKSGIIELIWAFYFQNEIVKIGTPWSLTVKFLGESDRITLPVVSNVNELSKALADIFSIYEDLKEEILKRQVAS